MEILKDGEFTTAGSSSSPTIPTLISNVEVMNVLQQHMERAKAYRRRNKTNDRSKQESEWIQAKVFDYLQSTPCQTINLSSSSEAFQVVAEFKSILQGTKKLKRSIRVSTAANTGDSSCSSTIPTGFGLTEAESIQVLNLMPQHAVEIHLVIEELNSRLSDGRQQELIDLIGSYTKRHQPTQQQQDDKEQLEAIQIDVDKNNIAASGSTGNVVCSYDGNDSRNDICDNEHSKKAPVVKQEPNSV